MDKEIKFDNLLRVLEEYSILLKDQITNVLVKNKKDGTIDKTMKFRVNIVGTKYILLLDIEDYFKYIESGRRKGAKQPPISAILKWIKAKHIIPRINKKIKYKIKTDKQLAFVIARGISKNGIKKLPILNKAIKNVNQIEMDNINKAIQIDIENYLKNNITDNINK